jgi:sugar O-acyltransferase (sialic acid O-acetyltransferase NeuD family)
MQCTNNRFILWGGTGQAKVLADIILLHLNGIIEAVFDINPLTESPIDETPIYYGIEGYTNWLNSRVFPKPLNAIAAIGGARGRDRYNYFKVFRSDGFMTPTLIHPSATVLRNAIIGENCQVLAHAVIGANACIGDACIINTKASIDHECIISEGVHVAPGATLCGNVKVGAFAFIGAGAVLLPNVKVGENAILGAGSVVTRDIPDNVVAFGNPARIIKENL